MAGLARHWRFESLDYPFAIAGVPRLVSGAGAGSAPVPCLLITQSAGFSNLHARRYQRRCGARGSQGVPAYCGMHSSRFRFFPREAPNGLPPGRIRSPLLYRLSYRLKVFYTCDLCSFLRSGVIFLTPALTP